jgi:hypothetical protein
MRDLGFRFASSGLRARRAPVRTAFAGAVLGVAVLLVGAASATADGTRNITSSGTARFAPAAFGADGIQFPEFRGGESEEGTPAPFDGRIVNRRESRGRGPGGDAPGNPRDRNNAQLVTSFDGLTHRDQRLANGGNQFSLEPPDQGLCAGSGRVLETVNDVLKVFDQAGNTVVGTTDLNTFFGYPAQFNRTTGVQGPFVTDPSCLFDAATQRWFLTVLTLEVFPDTGEFTGRNTIDVAVSTSPDPTGSWTIYHLPVQDDGTDGTPDHGCNPADEVDPDTVHEPTNPTACLGDYPHIGADARGFYVTTNEYDFFGDEFHAAQVYAFSKRALAAATPTLAVTQIDTVGADRGNPGFTIWPATSPGTADFATGQGGTEYFLSSNAAEEANGAGVSRDLLVWSLTNTASLDSATPNVTLDHRVLRVGRYGTPPPSNQKPGDFPLGQCINDTTTELAPGVLGCWQLLVAAEPAHDETEYALDSNDTRMQQVVFAGGRLYGALDTALTMGAGGNKAGIEYFIVRPKENGAPRASLNRFGYVGLRDNNLTYPAIGVLPSGRGVMAFTVVGDDHYPSAGYASISASTGVGGIHVAKEGLGPADGFSGYKAFGDPPRPRWGDYGAAVPDGSSIWIASEYIGQTCTLEQYLEPPVGSCGSTRTALANWYTRISRLTP